MTHLPSCASLALLLGVCALRLERTEEGAGLLIASEKIRLAAGASRSAEEDRLWHEARREAGVDGVLTLAPGETPDTLLAVVDRWLGVGGSAVQRGGV